MIYFKTTWGYVSQRYDSETGDCVQQEFIADSAQQVQRLDEAGNAIPDGDQVELQNTEKECAMDMVQP
jgi:hypothetical protein